MYNSLKNNKLIIKIFDSKDRDHYNQEKEFLSKFIGTEYIINLKTFDIRIENSNVFVHNSTYLLFDYLQHGNLSQYLLYMENYPDISEEFVKLFNKYMKKPELLEFVLKKYGFLAKDCALIGDSENDLQAAKANGVEFIGVLWGYGTEKELSGAQKIIKNPKDIE